MIDAILFKTQEGLDVIKENLKKRNANLVNFEKLEIIVVKRKKLIEQTEKYQAQRNKYSKEIGIAKAKGDDSTFEEIKQKVSEISKSLANSKEELEDIEEKFQEIYLSLPNILEEDVPVGVDEENNKELYIDGDIPQYNFEVLPHYEISDRHQLIDFERGVKLSGSRFYVYNEKIAKLERDLINFMLKNHEQAGYRERMVPLLVNDNCMIGTGQFPKFKDEYYRLDKDELSLIPTAEVPLTNLHANEIFKEDDLPFYITAATSCFRREAGSAGKDTRGLIRVHQFQKVELVKFCKPEDSEKELETLTNNAEEILKKLKLTYRRLLLCSGDTSGSSAKTYDLEVWMPGLKRWMEISSCSNFHSYQSRRAKIRYKNKETKKNEYIHTLNGSGVAAGRLIAALLEYYQTKDKNIQWDVIYDLIK